MCSACTLLVCQLVFMSVCVGWGLGDGLDVHMTVTIVCASLYRIMEEGTAKTQ